MRSVNKVILMGYLANDPEILNLSNDVSIAKFKLATNRDWKTSDGEKHQATDYHKVVVWRKLAEICAENLKKGSGIYLEGRIMNRQYEDQDGKNRVVTEIVGDNINFVTFKKNKNIEELNLVEVPV